MDSVNYITSWHLLCCSALCWFLLLLEHVAENVFLLKNNLVSVNVPSEDISSACFLSHYAAHLSGVILRQVVVAGRQLFPSLCILKQRNRCLMKQLKILLKLRD